MINYGRWIVQADYTEEIYMDQTSKPVRKPDFRLELLDNEMLLYHPVETRILHFNQTASLIWYLCDGEHTVDEITQMLQGAYPEAAEIIATDVSETLEQFAGQGCIEWV
jgi:hypothetical protein